MNDIAINVIANLIAGAIGAMIVLIFNYANKKFLDTQVKWKWAILLVGLTTLALSAFFTSVGHGFFPPPQVASASLVSARYMAAGFDPHLIDFRTAAEDGIPFGAGQSLSLIDVWIWGSVTSADYQAQVQLYVNDELIGETRPQPLKAGIYPLGDIVPTRDFFEDTTDRWLIQRSWEVLDLRLVLLQGETVIHEERFPIKHNANGLSRMLDMPLASIVTIRYRLNDGPVDVLDLSTVVRTGGLPLQVGDQFTLYEIWYNTDTTNTSTSFDVSAYLTNGGYNEKTDRRSDFVVFNQGIHFIETSEQLNWVVDEKYRLLVITVERDDEAVIDRLIIPLA